VSACSGTGSASLKHFASWFILEGYFDAIHEFLTATFTSYIVHERQPTKLRIEVPSELPTGGKRLLSSMFKALEGSKTQLHIKDYSMAQTSLEQIFNFFAQQQEEEQGSAGALSASVDNKEQ
jgi:ATP-binding cassette subfamily A (ABC1) protein 3